MISNSSAVQSVSYVPGSNGTKTLTFASMDGRHNHRFSDHTFRDYGGGQAHEEMVSGTAPRIGSR